MILIGTMNWSSTRSRGMFHCPNCETKEVYRQKASRPFLTLYFIPILPIGGVNEFVQCANCKSSFDPSILVTRLTHQPANEEKSTLAEDEFSKDLLQVIALIILEDGQVSEQEIAVARKLYEGITRKGISREQLGRTCSQARLRRLHLPSLLLSIAQRRSHEEKLLIVQAMFGVAGAEGAISPGRLQALTQSQVTLQ